MGEPLLALLSELCSFFLLWFSPFAITGGRRCSSWQRLNKTIVAEDKEDKLLYLMVVVPSKRAMGSLRIKFLMASQHIVSRRMSNKHMASQPTARPTHSSLCISNHHIQCRLSLTCKTKEPHILNSKAPSSSSNYDCTLSL